MRNFQSFHGMRRQVAVFGLVSLLLSGCMTGKKAEEAAAEASADQAVAEAKAQFNAQTGAQMAGQTGGQIGAQAGAQAGAFGPAQAGPTGRGKSLFSKGGMTGSNPYIDPSVTTNPARRQAMAARMPGTAGMPAQSAGTMPQNAYSAAPGQPTPSIAGAVTQPTGVRAGSFSIFSSTAPPPAMAASAQATGPIADASAPGNFNAASGSVFTPHQPLSPASCTINSQGNPVGC